MYAVRGRLKKDLDSRSATEILQGFSAQARQAATPHVLVSQEQLAGAGPKQMQRLHRALPEHEIHLVLTVRCVARQVPSTWQERVKTRGLLSLGSYVESVLERGEEGLAFWRYQDLPKVLERISGELPSERVHIVTVPSGTVDPDVLLGRFCAVVGVDHRRLPDVAVRDNSSLGVVQAELLRRVNVALGDRLPRPRAGYAQVAKWYLAARVLQLQSSRSPLMPAASASWCREVADGWITAITEGGYHLVGELSDLVPVDEHFTTDDIEVPADQIATAAVDALAQVLCLRHEENAVLDELRARVRELEDHVARHRPARLFARRQLRSSRSGS
jgi:hypothetical protein